MSNQLSRTSDQEEKLLVHYLTTVQFKAQRAGGICPDKQIIPFHLVPALAHVDTVLCVEREVLVSKLMHQNKNTATMPCRYVNDTGQRLK